MRAIQQPFEIYFDLDGSPLEGGAIYIGEANKNPELYPVQVFTDKTGMQPIAQPVGTIGGYLSRNGSPCALFTAGSYSMTVRNSRGEIVYNLRDSAEGGSQGGDGTENAVDDFGAVGDGVTDNFSALADIFSSTDSKVFVPAGIYNLESMVTIDIENMEICGVRGQTIIRSSNLSKMFDLVRMVNSKICGITFLSDSALVAAADGVVCGDSAVLDNSVITWCQFEAPVCNAGGFVVNGTTTIDGFFFIDNVVRNVGAKGVLFSGSACSGLKLDMNIIENTGLFASADGDGLSIGGAMNDAVASNTTVINAKTNAFNLYDHSRSTIDGLSCQANSRVCGARISGTTDVKLDDLFLPLSDYFTVNASTNIRASNVNIKSSAINALRFTGASEFNEFHLGTWDNSASADNVNGAVVLSDGAGAQKNRLSHLRLEPRTGKTMVKQINTAKQPEIIHCYNAASGDVVSSDLLDWNTFALATDAGLILEKQAKYQVMDGVVHCFFRIEVLEDAGVTSGNFAIFGLPVTPDRTLMGEDTDPIIRAQRFLMTGAATISNVSELPDPTKSYYIPEYQHIAESAPLPAEDRIFLHLLSGDASTDMSTWRDKLLLVGSFSYPAGA